MARARAGDGPTLIECKTYRWHGHSEHDKAFYRTDEELAMWKSRDPIPTFTTYLRARHVLDDDKLKDIEARDVDDRRRRGVRDERADPNPEDAVTTCMRDRRAPDRRHGGRQVTTTLYACAWCVKPI